MTKSLDHHAALIYTMVTTSAVDRTMSGAELSRIGEIVSHLPVFADYNADGLVDASQACGELLGSEAGLELVLELIRSGLPMKLRETAYALALEVAAADLDVRPEEARFLELLAEALEIDMLTKTAIERGIRARNKIL